MKGFHIDMNVAQFTRPYLEQWLRRLAELGYDTLVWEVENNIRWRSVPGVESPDAFSPEEFKEILALARELGFESIPLLQVLAHCEYVLKHPQYRHLSEHPDKFAQYCPRNPQLLPFLNRWIDEYLEVFGPVKYFHVGADESWWLGSCDQCKAYAEQHSLGELFLDHFNAVVGPIINMGIRPVAWADMVLSHPEIADRVPKQVVMFDWMYDIYRGNGKVFVWGDLKMCTKDEIPPDKLAHYHRFLFPHGDEPGREPETFYTADFLRDKGFTVVTCPGSSHHGDTNFAGRSYLHLANTFDSWHKGRSLNGSVLTSWTVHLFPWELQLPTVELAAWINEHPDGSIAEFQRTFTQSQFGFGTGDDALFWRSAGLLSKPVLFGSTRSLGHNKSCPDVSLTHVRETIEKLRADGDKLAAELANARQRLVEYNVARDGFRELIEKAPRGADLLRRYEPAARNLVHRAQSVIFLLTQATGSPEGNREDLLARLRTLRTETEAMYAPIHKPTRRAQILGWLYAPLERALSGQVS